MPGWQSESHPRESTLVRLRPGQLRSGNAHRTVHVPALKSLIPMLPHSPQNNLTRLECGVFLPSTHLPGAFLTNLLTGTSQVELIVTGPQGFEAILALNMFPHLGLSAQHLYYRQPAGMTRGRVCPTPSQGSLWLSILTPQFPVEGGCLLLLPCLGYY